MSPIAIILVIIAIVISLLFYADHNKQQQRKDQQLKDLQQQLDNTKILHDQYYANLKSNYHRIEYEINSYNVQIKDINEKLQNVQQYHPDQFDDDGIHLDTYNIVLLGQTGFGKSTLGNRLCGDISQYGNQICFKTSTGTERCTESTEKKIVKGLYPKMLSIIDTPGFFDTKHSDDLNVEHLVATLRGSGGINAFLMFGADRFDVGFQQILRNMTAILGEEFWKHMIFVRTKVYGLHRENLDEWKSDFVKSVSHEFKFVDTDKLRIFALDTWYDYKQHIREEFIAMIPEERFNCKAIESPLSVRIKTQIEQKLKDIQKKKEKQKDINQELKLKYVSIVKILNEIKKIDPDDLSIVSDTIKEKETYLKYSAIDSIKKQKSYSKKKVEVIDFAKKDFATFIVPLIITDETRNLLDSMHKTCGVSMKTINSHIQFLNGNYPHLMISIDHICSLVGSVSCAVCNMDTDLITDINNKKYEYYVFLCENWIQQNMNMIIIIGFIIFFICIVVLISHYAYKHWCDAAMPAMVDTNAQESRTSDDDEKVPDPKVKVSNPTDEKVLLYN